jgi:hypothetical protein
MSNNWITSFTQAMQRLGRHKQFFIEPCKEHNDCVFVQVRLREEHVPWRERMPDDVARALSK